MNRTVQEATAKAFHAQTLTSLAARLKTSLAAHYFTKHLETQRSRTPFHAVGGTWKNEPTSFTINAPHRSPGTKHLGPVSRTPWLVSFLASGAPGARSRCPWHGEGA